MKTEDIRKMAQAWNTVQEASKKKMDPVDQDELKGTHAQRKDKDIDNDGDADASDEYLHNRRKAVSKAMKKDDAVTMNPKAEAKIDEISKNKINAYRQKSSDEFNRVQASGEKMTNKQKRRYATGSDAGENAFKKLTGRARVNATEEFELDEAGIKTAYGTTKTNKYGGGSSGKSIIPKRGTKAYDKWMADANARHARLHKLKNEEADWPIYNRILESRAMHYKGAAPTDPMDKGQSPGGKKMKKDIDIDTSGKISNYDDLGHDDASKAGRITKKAPGRTNDRSEGDKNVVNPVKDTTK